MSRCILSVGLVCALLACNGPTAVFPGGRLDGESRSAPEAWAFSESYGTAQLETRPAEPYSVNVAYTVIEGALYVNAGDSETRWVKHIAADPRVRIRIDDVVYEARAERVTDDGEIAAFGRVWEQQAPFLRDPSKLEGEVWVYRLAAR